MSEIRPVLSSTMTPSVMAPTISSSLCLPSDTSSSWALRFFAIVFNEFPNAAISSSPLIGKR